MILEDIFQRYYIDSIVRGYGTEESVKIAIDVVENVSKNLDNYKEEMKRFKANHKNDYKTYSKFKKKK